MVSHLCKIANVIRSGYYEWLENIKSSTIREEPDYQEYLLLKSIYDTKKEENRLSRVLHGYLRFTGNTYES